MDIHFSTATTEGVLSSVPSSFLHCSHQSHPANGRVVALIHASERRDHLHLKVCFRTQHFYIDKNSRHFSMIQIWFVCTQIWENMRRTCEISSLAWSIAFYFVSLSFLAFHKWGMTLQIHISFSCRKWDIDHGTLSIKEIFILKYGHSVHMSSSCDCMRTPLGYRTQRTVFGGNCCMCGKKNGKSKLTRHRHFSKLQGINGWPACLWRAFISQHEAWVLGTAPGLMSGMPKETLCWNVMDCEAVWQQSHAYNGLKHHWCIGDIFLKRIRQMG